MRSAAFISDIHGNKPALEAVLSDIESRAVATVYCLGDPVEAKRVIYDTEAAALATLKAGLPPGLAEGLRLGR